MIFLINSDRRICYNLNNTTVCMHSFNPVMVVTMLPSFNCMPVGRVSGSLTDPT